MFQKDPSELRNEAAAALKLIDTQSKFPTYEVCINPYKTLYMKYLIMLCFILVRIDIVVIIPFVCSRVTREPSMRLTTSSNWRNDTL